MHIFMLILMIAGQPERAGAFCETYKQCSDLGEAAQATYLKQFHKTPDAFSYRVLPVVVVPEPST
jgi:hypothetical protein